MAETNTKEDGQVVESWHRNVLCKTQKSECVVSVVVSQCVK